MKLSETETIDKLFLELSQFTNARTKRELALIEPLELAIKNGTHWTLEDWQNWRTYHAEAALGNQPRYLFTRRGDWGKFRYCAMTEHEGRTALLNTSILTDYGVFEYAPLSPEDAREIAIRENCESAIGHESTAEILTELLGIPVAVNRTNNKQAPGDRAIVFKLRGRPEEGRVLTRADIDRIGYDFGLLTRIS